ncbi:MAG TPA: hypothetical protein VFA81_10770 [Burkholderiales bacterium]|nr:hypothetical protein [Burkholderiales bacterium]
MKSFYVTTKLTRRDMFWQDAIQAADAINARLGANGRTADARDSEAEIERLNAEHLALTVESIEAEQ